MRISDWSSDVCSSDLQLITCHSQRLVERLTQLLHDGADTVLPAGRHAKRMQPERHGGARQIVQMIMQITQEGIEVLLDPLRRPAQILVLIDRKSTRLNSSHKCATRIPSFSCTKT